MLCESYKVIRVSKRFKTFQGVIYRLETYIWNIIDCKHQNRLETKFLDLKHDDEIGNKKKYIGSKPFRLET